MLLISVWLASFFPSSVILADGLAAAPLEEALWEGRLRLTVSGPLFSQRLANKVNDSGIIIGFTKEKGQMQANYSFEAHFYVNALGEVTMASAEDFEGRLVMDREFWYRFEEDHKVEATRVTNKRMVRVQENTNYQFTFAGDNTYTEQDFEIGSFRVLPSGRMDRKGEIRVIGEIETTFTAEGKMLLRKERQPPGDGWAKQESSGEARMTIKLPISFETTLRHRKDPVDGPLQVTFDMENPFIFPDAPDQEPDVYTPKLTATGTLSLKPLFGKKR